MAVLFPNFLKNKKHINICVNKTRRRKKGYKIQIFWSDIAKSHASSAIFLHRCASVPNAAAFGLLNSLEMCV